jgi:predicted Zn-dependent protease
MVYSGLLSNTDLTDDELAALLAHDMAHALLEHARERVAARFEPGLLDGMGRDDAKPSQVAYEIVVGVIAARPHETEADRLGVELSARAGFDPMAAVSLFSTLDRARVRATAEWIRRHPMAPERRAFLTAQAARVKPLYEQAPTSPRMP